MHIKMIKKYIIMLIILFGINYSFCKDKIKIDQVNLIGVNSVEEKEIRNVLRIHEGKLFSKMEYDRRLVKLDAINIKTFYVSKGFLGANVKDSVIVSEEFADIFYIIEEGEKYFVKSISIVGNEVIKSDTVKSILNLGEQKPYNPVKTNANFHLLEDRYRQRGKLFAKINISDDIDDSVSVLINIAEGPDVYVNNTFITGLGLTDTTIARREMLLGKGDIYNQKQINNSQRQLIQSGLFSVANISPVKFAKSDSIINLLVELRKFKQFEWISEGGYYPIEFYEGTEPEPGAGVLVEWRNRSLFNSATSFSTKLSGQTLISNNSINPKLRFDISVENPWLYKFKIPSKAQIYIESFKDYISVGAPYVTRYGLELINTFFIDKVERRSFIESRLHLDRFSRKDYLYLENNELLDTYSSSGTRSIKVEKHSFQINFRYDKSDNPLYPSKGVVYLGQLNRTGGILGGNQDFIKVDFGIRAYQPIYKKIVLAGRIKYGTIFGWNDEISDYLYDKFYLGGANSLRGWDILRLKTDANDREQGDVIRLLNNWEIRFPLFWLIGGEAFVDGGQLYNNTDEVSLKNLSWNAGFGVTLTTPLGPVRLDAAKPISEDLGWKINLGVQYIF